MILQAIRSLIFYLLFIGQTAMLAIPFGTLARINPKLLPWAVASYWFRSNLFFLRWIVGIRTSVTGDENLPAGGVLIAAKHQSDWDILALLPHTPKPAFIAKQELLNIPFFGWAARRFETIEIDRSKGGEALPALIEGVKAALARGCQVVIFPEGTRKAPLAEPDYRWGVAKIYTACNVPVIPVALNSGLYWGRNSPILWPGTARARILEPIPPGLPLEAFQARLIETIEGETEKLIVEDIDRGLTGPLTPALRERLASRRKMWPQDVEAGP